MEEKKTFHIRVNLVDKYFVDGCLKILVNDFSCDRLDEFPIY